MVGSSPPGVATFFRRKLVKFGPCRRWQGVKSASVTPARAPRGPVASKIAAITPIIERLEALPDSSLARAFERHVHWGYFASPETADDSVERYVAAAEELTRRMCEAAGVADGLNILDVGCGFGGTIDHLNAHLATCTTTTATLNTDTPLAPLLTPSREPSAPCTRVRWRGLHV